MAKAKMTKEQINEKFEVIRLAEEAAEKIYLKNPTFENRMAHFDAQQVTSKFMARRFNRGE